jgi:hypothetical protein
MRSFAIATLLSAACAVNAANIIIAVGNGGVRLVSSSTTEINFEFMPFM